MACKLDNLLKIASDYLPDDDFGGNDKLHAMIEFAIEAVKGTKNQFALYILLQSMAEAKNDNNIVWERYIEKVKKDEWE